MLGEVEATWEAVRKPGSTVGFFGAMGSFQIAPEEGFS